MDRGEGGRVPIVVLSGPDQDGAPRLSGAGGLVPLHGLAPGVCLRRSDGAGVRVRMVQVAGWRGIDLVRAPHLHPVLIRRNALGAGRPARDIHVSPNARFRGLAALSLLSGAAPGGLVAAKHLAGLPGVHRVEPLSCRFVYPVLEMPGAVVLEGLLLHLAPRGHMADVWSHAARTELEELFGTARSLASLLP